jgi:HEAT repeat protein
MNMKFFFALCLTSILVVAAPGAADRPIKSTNKPWESLERELADKGTQTDGPSLAKAALANPDPMIRQVAVELMGFRGEASAKGTLREVLLNDDSLLVRETSALALVRLGEPGAVEEVKAFLQASDKPVRQLFLAAELAELGDFSGYSQVAKIATSDDEHLRFLSVESVVRIRFLDSAELGKEPGALLSRLMEDDSPKVRRESVFQLSVALFRGFSLQPYLYKIKQIAKHDPDAEVREQAELLLNSWEQFGKSRSEQ